MRLPKHGYYVVSDGVLTLHLEPDEDRWYAITSPDDSSLITQARTLKEAFLMAYDAQKLLTEYRRDHDHRP